MADNSKQPNRVVALANRLRLLQVDSTDQGDDVRREYLTEEVRRALGTVPANERKAFLDELQEQFPTWDAKVEVRAPSVQAALDRTELKDPSFLVTRLIEVCKSLSEDQRRVVTDRLAEAGLVGVGTPDWPAKALGDAREALQLAADKNIDMGRALELLTHLVRFVLNLNRAAWATWNTMSPNSTIRPQTQLTATLGRFASGNLAVGSEQVGSEVMMLRKLTGGLISAHAQTGRIAVQHFRSFSPEQIALLVGSTGWGLETRCWRKYGELYGGIESGSIEDSVRIELADFVEKLIRGTQ